MKPAVDGALQALGVGPAALFSTLGRVGARGIPVDVADPESVTELATTVADSLGTPTVLVNCAGVDRTPGDGSRDGNTGADVQVADAVPLGDLAEHVAKTAQRRHPSPAVPAELRNEEHGLATYLLIDLDPAADLAGFVAANDDLVALAAVVPGSASASPRPSLHKVQVKVDRGAKVSTLEVDIEFPNAGASAARASPWLPVHSATTLSGGTRARSPARWATS